LGRSLNPENVKAVITWVNQGPFFRLLGMEIVELGIGLSVVEIAMEEKHHHPFGSVHGGVYAALIDTACFWAPYGDMDEGLGWTTLDLQTNNLTSAKEGTITARGSCIRTGRTFALTECIVTDQSGRVLAHGTSKLLIGKELLKIGSLEGVLPPPKFLNV
jgi:uncharacterized protein (TIGR00369 family)